MLKPKAAGFALTLSAFEGAITKIIDLTICSEKPLTGSSFLMSNCGQLRIEYTVHDVIPEMMGDFSKDRSYRSFIQGWLNERWKEKDDRIKAIRSEWEKEKNKSSV